MYLVTGAAGLSGQMIVNDFAAKGIPVRALVRDRSRAPAFDASIVDVVQGDMARPESLRAALAGVEKALMISSADPHMAQTQCSFVDACVRAGVGHVVKFSGTEGGIDRSAFCFTDMHARAEEYLEQSGLAWTHLRPSQFMQVYLRELPTVAARRELRLPLGDATLAPVDVLDIARIAVQVMLADDQEGRVHQITGPEALDMRQVADALARAAGHPVRYIALTPEQRRDEMVAAGAPASWADALLEQSRERLRNPKAQIHLQAHRRFGVPPTTFADFLSRNAPAFEKTAA